MIRKHLILAVPLALLALQPDARVDVLFQQAQHHELVDGRLGDAIDLYKRIIATNTAPRSTVALALTEMGRCFEKLGRLAEARQAYERALRDFPDQSKTLALARTRLSAITKSGAVSPSTAAVQSSSRRIWQAGSNRLLHVSPDGSFLSYAGNRGPLHIRELAGGHSWTVPVEGFVDSASFNDDGTRMAMTLAVGSFRGIHIVPVSRFSRTAAPELVYRSPTPNQTFVVHAWMPDGHRLVLTVWSPDQRTSRLGVFNIEDGSIEWLPAPGDARGLTVQALPSPDGRHLAIEVSTQNFGSSDIWIQDVSSGEQKLVVDHPANDNLIGWTDGGKSIVFRSDRSGTPDIWVQPLNAASSLATGQLPVMVKRDAGQHRTVGFSSGTGSVYQWVESGGNEIHTLTIDPESGRLLSGPSPLVLRHPLNRRAPGDAAMSWSPDGKLLAYLAKGDTSTGRSNGLIVKSLETGDERRVPVRQDLYFFQPEWSPDQAKFLVTGNDATAKPGLFLIDRVTGADHRLTTLPSGPMATVANGAWFPEGRAVFYKGVAPAEHQRQMPKYVLLRKELADEGLEPVILGDAPLREVHLSKDGTRIAYSITDRASRTTQLLVRNLPLSHAPPREVLRMQAPADLIGLSWSADGRWLYYLQGSPAPSLWRIQTAEAGDLAKPPQRIADLPGPAYGASVHPNGASIGFTLSRRENELWAVEGFLLRMK